ncbi:hypothetical protein [Microvirga mediterraneensis]|uniref:Uncharacterized protein n=1 Tax=Microvirga mediterraneensis TaxID=2754695 RepID=A0A838BQS2_9HYPH|nr:hypothetical protein [Microvirga mediterraneensis]MBA1157731.1 hypothetical protein [Microvirga mediterraneensis]
MTEEEIEIVAEELAKIGGVTWYPGREKGTLMRVVCDRYRDRARVAIQALDRYRAGQKAALEQDNRQVSTLSASNEPHAQAQDEIRPGVTVVYRPPGDRRAYSCRVIEIEGNRAYLAPILRACTDWVSIEHLVPAREHDKAVAQE